jgi:adenine-specific DNA-methyltransferase
MSKASRQPSRDGRRARGDVDGAQRPVLAADQAGNAYADGVSAEHRKSYGLYLTPPEVADFMAAQALPSGSTIRILEPAAGAGILICALVEALVQRSDAPRRVEILAYEIDPNFAPVLAGVLARLSAWGAKRGIEIEARVENQDFVLAHAPVLEAEAGLFTHLKAADAFDLVIANPPYFKLNKADPRAQAAAAVVHGQPNIYGLFMAIAAAALKPGGTFIFITPRSFASGPYFRRFREHFFECIRPELVHIFASRKDAFGRDAVLQENVIFKGIRQDGWSGRNTREIMGISSSQGLGDLRNQMPRSVRLEDVLDMKSRDKVLKLPTCSDDEDLVRLVESWTGSLDAYGLRISTGPVVPFRATELIEKAGDVTRTHVPLLWMNHVRGMQVTWPLGRHKPEYMAHTKAAQPLLVPNVNYVLMRRFSAKEEARRLVAAPYLAKAFSVSMIGLENHLNYVYRPKGQLTEHEAIGLAALFNSALLDGYFRISNGNTQVSATELRAIPLPSLAVITALGQRVQREQPGREALDTMVMALATTAQPQKKELRRGHG